MTVVCDFFCIWIKMNIKYMSLARRSSFDLTETSDFYWPLLFNIKRDCL